MFYLESVVLDENHKQQASVIAVIKGVERWTRQVNDKWKANKLLVFNDVRTWLIITLSHPHCQWTPLSTYMSMFMPYWRP